MKPVFVLAIVASFVGSSDGQRLTISTIAGGGAAPVPALSAIQFFGDAPGYPGYYQVNFRLPSGVAPGPSVPVRLNYLSRPSNDVTVAVQ